MKQCKDCGAAIGERTYLDNRCLPCQRTYKADYARMMRANGYRYPMTAEAYKAKYEALKANPANRIKNATRQRTLTAIRNGKLVRQPCERCGHGETQAHHHDYTQALQVSWLCRSCHGYAHRSIEKGE